MRKSAIWKHSKKYPGMYFTSSYKTNRRKWDRSFELKETIIYGRIKPKKRKKSIKFISFESWQAAVSQGWKKVI